MGTALCDLEDRLSFKSGKNLTSLSNGTREINVVLSSESFVSFPVLTKEVFCSLFCPL